MPEHMQDALHRALVQEVLAIHVVEVQSSHQAADRLHAVRSHLPACARLQRQGLGDSLRRPGQKVSAALLPWRASIRSVLSKG